MTAFVAGRAGAVGKVPSSAEYLPVPTHAASFAALDTWLTQGTEWALRYAGASFEATFAGGPMHGFVFHAPGDAADSLLCGAVAPSRDSAGRQFPAVFAAPLRMSGALLPRPELLPFCLEDLWGTATAGLGALLSGHAPAQVVATWSPGAPTESTEADQAYGEWAAVLPLTELWAQLGPALASPADTIRFLFETLSPLRGIDLPDTTLSLRLPLGAAGGAGLCAWLDLVRRYLGWQRTLPSFFWSHDGVDGSALVFLGQPPKSALSELWSKTDTRDEIAELTKPIDPPTTANFAPLPGAVSDLLGRPDARLADLLESLVR